MKHFLISLLSLTIIHAQTEGSKLLDEAIMKPGSFSQMCDMQFIPAKIPISLYAPLVSGEAKLSSDVLKKLRSERKKVVSELREKLAVLDVSCPYQNSDRKFAENEDKILDSGISPNNLSSLLYSIIMDLNAVEILPELLRIENDLSTMLEINAADANVLLPNIYNDIPISFEFFGQTDDKKSFAEKFKTEGKSNAKHIRTQCIIAQRDCLSTILVLLRNQKYEPLLSSDIEKAFAEAVIKKSTEEDFKNFSSNKDIPENDRGWIIVDPITNKPTAIANQQATFPYSPETREKIRNWVKDWLEKNPAEKRDGTKGMLAYPVER